MSPLDEHDQPTEPLDNYMTIDAWWRKPRKRDRDEDQPGGDEDGPLGSEFDE